MQTLPTYQPLQDAEAEAALESAALLAETLVPLMRGEEAGNAFTNRERVQIIAARLWNLT